VVVWTTLILSATLGIVGLIGLFHECWTSAQASAVSHGNEAHTPPLCYEPQSTYDLLLHKDVSPISSGGQQDNLVGECVSAK
jgi:hypothetical protein